MSARVPPFPSDRFHENPVARRQSYYFRSDRMQRALIHIEPTTAAGVCRARTECEDDGPPRRSPDTKVYHTFSDGYQYPEEDIDYPGADVAGISDVPTWTECSERCREKSECRIWTWVTGSYWKTSQRHYCYLKKGKVGRRRNDGVVSGVVGGFPRKA